MNFVECIRFNGNLIGCGERVPVVFDMQVDRCGKLNLHFEPLTSRAGMRIINWPRPGRNVEYLDLEGTSSTGEQLYSDSFYMTSFESSSDVTEGTTIKFFGRCAQAKLLRGMQAPSPHKQLIWYLRQFETFGPMRRDTAFGRVRASGAQPSDNSKHLTGHIAIEAPDDTDEGWWEQSDKLLDHITRVLSLARGTYLRPIVERRVQGSTDIFKVSELDLGENPFLSPFHPQNLQPIFDCACDSFAELAVVMKSLDPAIQWLLAPASYDEIRLISAMTALENIVEAAYPEKKTRIVPRGTFDKFAKAVRTVIRERGLPQALQLKLPELNRPPLIDKLTRYVDERGIIIADFAQNALEELIKARDVIVHRGLYFEADDPDQVDVWEHIIVPKELAIRILLKALRFEGSYFSALHEGKQLSFPSCRPLS